MITTPKSSTSALIAAASFCKQRSVSLLWTHALLCLVLATVFIHFSSIDPWVSGLFFKEMDLGLQSAPPAGFWLNKYTILNTVYVQVNVLSRVALITTLVLFILRLRHGLHHAFFTGILLAALLVGPMLTVNGIFKEYWGRARPNEIELFHGSQKFTPAWIISNQCQHNCSFTSGHAAAGFALSLGYLVSRRRIWLPAGVVLGGLIGLTRMVNGAHFLSDVVFSYFLVMLSAALASWIISSLTLYVYKNQKH